MSDNEKHLTVEQTHALEQRQADRGKTSAATKARLVDQNPITAGGPNA